MRKLLRKLRYLLRRDRQADELAEELELHRGLVEREGLEEGLTPEEARRRARLRMGNETLAREDARFVWSFVMIEDLLRDLRYGIRMLSRNARSTAVTVLALALGIGLNAAVFTAYKAMVARPLDARDPDEMVNIGLTRDSGATATKFSYPDYEAYRDSVRSFSGVIAFRMTRATLSNVGGIAEPRDPAAGSWMVRMGRQPHGASNAESPTVFVVSENYFKVLGVTTLHGRTFDSLDADELAANPAVLISENYWQSRFAGDPSMLGKTIHLNGQAVTVIGITPRDFVGTSMQAPPFWLPISNEPLTNRDDQWLLDRENERYELHARLAPGVSTADAQAEMTSVADHLRTLHDPESESAGPVTALVWPGSPFPFPLEQAGALTLVILLIMGAAAMVLVVACANVGSLQLARARARQGELRTRFSLGAGRLRVLRQLLTESALVGLLAGCLALLFSWAFTKVLATEAANMLPIEYGTIVFDVTPDNEIFAYVFAVSLLAGMLSGLAPAMESSRSALTSGVRGGTSSVRTRRLQDILVTAQVCLSLVLLIAASMLIRGSMNSLKMPTGYDSEQVIAVDFHFPETAKYTAARKVALTHELRTGLAALPGVASITSAHPPGGRRYQTAAVALREGEGSDRGMQSILFYNHVEADYFQTLGISLIRGRGFQAQGREPGYSIIVSESAAEELWPKQNPIGRSLRLGATDEKHYPRSELLATGPAYQVVGVVHDKRGLTFDGSDSNEIYLPLRDRQPGGRSLLIRTESDPAHVRRAIDTVILSVDSSITATSSTLEEMLWQSPLFSVASIAAAVASTVGLFGLLLALMGIYGTVSYVVVLRTREVGIRMAMGAQKRDVLGLILREITRPVVAGLLFGMLVAAGTSYLVRGFFYGLISVDGTSVLGVSLLFLVIALFASYPPARRAMHVEPVVALRHE